RRAELELVVPETLDAAAREALPERGVHPFRITEQRGDETVVRDIWASLVLSSGERSERLDFPDELSFEDREFRLAFALQRLATGEPTRVAFVSDLPRLSPAEAHEEFQLRMKFAPSGTDVYSLARASLERAGFEVIHVDTRPSPPGSSYIELPPDLDALVWLQPRRDITYVLEALTRYLHGGGRAVLFAQHFNVQAERHRGRGFDLAFWPQPQSADIEVLWLPELGVELERSILFDELSFPAPIRAEVNRSADERDYDAQVLALPFQIRASNANFAPGPILRGVGDQAFLWGNAIELDHDALERSGLEAEVLIETSPRSWSDDWQGGFVDPERIAGPADGAFDGPRPLAARIHGRFPLPDEPLRQPFDGESPPLPPPPGAGELTLVGASEPLKNEWILGPEFRGDQLLINLVAHAALDSDLAALTGRRRVPRGLDAASPDERLLWRAVVIGGGPLGVGLAGLLASLFAARRVRRRAVDLAGRAA
ncbi:MAG: Gldg family protein, partial [Planctomycetota bacterium]